MSVDVKNCTRFGETVITNPVLTTNDAKRILHQNVVLALDLEKQ